MRKRLSLFPLLVFLLPVITKGQASPVLVLKARIPLANAAARMDHLGVDLKGERLFAADFDNHTLEIIDLKAGRLVHTISDLDSPQSAFHDAATSGENYLCPHVAKAKQSAEILGFETN